MFAGLSTLVDKYFNVIHQQKAYFNNTTSQLNIMTSAKENGVNLSNATDIISNKTDLSDMFPYLKNIDKHSSSFLSNLGSMLKALYNVSKITNNNVLLVNRENIEQLQAPPSQPSSLSSLEFTLVFKILFKYVFSQYSLICILNAFFLNKVSHMSERNTQHRRTTIRLQLTRQQLVNRRDEIARSLNDTSITETDVLESELLVIVGQLQEIDQQLARQQLLEEDELEKERYKVSFYKMFGMALHIVNILVMCYMVYYCHFRLFALEGSDFNSALTKYCSAVFYIVNWLECCIALNNQFNLLPHRKSILKYEGFTTFDYSLVLFMCHQFFGLGNHENHKAIFKFFVFNKLVYEIVTITLEIFQWKHYWLFLSTGIDLFFLSWFIQIVNSGCFSSLSLLYDPILILSGILLFLLYVPLIISYVFSAVSLAAFMFVAVAFKFQHLETLKYYQVFKKFKTHLSSCEGSEITVETNTDSSSNYKRLGTLNFNRSILQFCVFIMMNEKSDQVTTQENFILKTINTLYDSEFGYINRYITRRKYLVREFKTYPLSLNEMHLENLISHSSKHSTKSSGSISENHKFGDRSGERSDGFWDILLSIDRFNQFWQFIKTFGNLKKVAKKMEIASTHEYSLTHSDEEKVTNQDNFEPDYAQILSSDISAFTVDESLDYVPDEESCAFSSENEEEEKEDYENINRELNELLPRLDKFLITDHQTASSDEILEFETMIDTMKRQEIFNKISESLKLQHFTRSYYKKFLDNTVVLDMKHEMKKTHDYYSTLNPLLDSAQDIESSECEEEEDFTTDCVICTVNKRAIILWPCKCLAMCEDCRVSLAVKKFDHCPCCRTKIKGYSKINNV